MENFLKKPVVVPFETLFLDPNNPRLALEDPPSYENPKKLFDPELQKMLEAKIEEVYAVGDLEVAIETQGWMPIDNIVVWTYPNHPDRHVVVEGNTRTVALRKLRIRLVREREKLARMKEGRKKYAAHDITEQEEVVQRLERVVADTEKLTVVPLDADSLEELQRKLPRVLAVRHITGAKEWGNYAEDLWLLKRYAMLFEEEFPGKPLAWDRELVNRVAREASLGPTKARRQLQAASCFSHFKAEFEDQLPGDEEFAPSDYYLFENIVRKPWVRQQFELGEQDLHIPAEREQVLFKWVFKLPRPKTADENPNVFYRHENIVLWEQMQRYDEKHKTSFAKRFNVEDPDSAPRMHEVEAEYLAHKASRKPTDLLEQLLQQLGKLDVHTILSEGVFLKKQLERLHQQTGEVLRMIKAVKD